MNMKKTALSAAVLGAIGAAGMALPTTASAASLLTNGTWELTIQVTPTKSAYKFPTSCDAAGGTGTYCTTETSYIIGTAKKGWNTSFTFGSSPGAASVGGSNNGTNVSVTNDFSGYYGTGPGTYGTADDTQTDFGRLVFDITNGSISGGASADFQIDTFFATAGGDFAQFINGATGFTGSVDEFGNMTLGIDNRFGAINGPAGGVIGPWNYEPSASAPLTFTTGSMADPGTGTIEGAACTFVSAGEYDCILVSYGQVGSAWGTFKGNQYYEVWDIHMHQISAAPEVPVPAAVWLFGSGLLGLVGVARRKKTG